MAAKTEKKGNDELMTEKELRQLENDRKEKEKQDAYNICEMAEKLYQYYLLCFENVSDLHIEIKGIEEPYITIYNESKKNPIRYKLHGSGIENIKKLPNTEHEDRTYTKLKACIEVVEHGYSQSNPLMNKNNVRAILESWEKDDTKSGSFQLFSKTILSHMDNESYDSERAKMYRKNKELREQNADLQQQINDLKGTIRSFLENGIN